MIGVGAMIGAGIFVLTGLAAGAAGPAFILAFFLNGVITIFTAMAYAELGSTFPEAGGGYLWVKKALPQPSGFISGWMSWFAHAVACSLYSLGFGAYIYLIIKMLNINIPYLSEGLISKILAVFIIIIFTYINFRGASETGTAGSVITIVKIIILAIFIIAGLVSIFKNPQHSLSHFIPFVPKGFTGILFAMGLTFIAFEGYEIIVQAGEEIKNPRKNIPKAIFSSLIIVIPIYLLIAFVSIGAINANEPTWQYLGRLKEIAIVSVAKQLLPYGEFILLLGGLLSTMSALNATIYSSSRVSFAMGRDGSFPRIFSKIHNKRRTPYMATFLSSILIIIMAIALPIHDVASAADIMFLLLFLMVNITLINLRRTNPGKKRGFKIKWFPYIPILGILSNLFLAVFMFGFSRIAWYVTIIWIAGGIIFYYLYSRKKEISKEAEVSKTIIQKKEVISRDYKVLLPINNPDSLVKLVNFASMLTKFKKGQLTVLNVIEVPALLPLESGLNYVEKSKPLIKKAMDLATKFEIPKNSLIKVSHNTGKAIIDSVQEGKIDLMVLGWRGERKEDKRILGSMLDLVISNVGSDVMVLKMKEKSLDKIDRILLPIGNIKKEKPFLDLSISIAKAFNAKITVIQVIPPMKNFDIDSIKSEILELFNGKIDIREQNIIIIESKNIINTILKFSLNFDLLLLNAVRENVFEIVFLGNKVRNISRKSNVPLIILSKGEGKIKTFIEKIFGTRKVSI